LLIYGNVTADIAEALAGNEKLGSDYYIIITHKNIDVPTFEILNKDTPLTQDQKEAIQQIIDNQK
jgi:hypothetical protein